ncbi:hypothetical protein ACQVP2_28510 [Methylobacterium aquaticum]|uniref:hypothetical protein n=1 Tax=Methylobacterium aquaticum TaxID=270351 RepID=UPI003D178C1A
MADPLIPYVAPDGTLSLEAAAQLIIRLLIPDGDGLVTLPQALADRPRQAEVAAAIEAVQADVVDLGPLERAVAAAATAAAVAQDGLATRAALGGTVGPDADWTIPAGAVHVVIPPLTAARSWSLPDADGYPRGQDLVLVDEVRSLGPASGLLVIPLAGSGDSIAGFADGILLADAGASVRLRRGLLSDVWVVT